MADVEIYHSLTGKKKTYLVANHSDTYAFRKFARHYFHCTTEDTIIKQAYIYDGYLYLDNPHKRAQKTVLVAYYMKGGI